MVPVPLKGVKRGLGLREVSMGGGGGGGSSFRLGIRPGGLDGEGGMDLGNGSVLEGCVRKNVVGGGGGSGAPWLRLYGVVRGKASLASSKHG